MTTHQNPPQSFPPPQPWGGPPPYWQPPPPKRTLAVWALGLGITACLAGLVLGFVPFTVLLWLVGMAVAIIAMRRVHTGRSGGRSMAITAVTLAGVALLCMIVGSTTTTTTPAGSAAPVVAPQPARTVTEAEWNLISRDPDAHVGERVIVYGQVTQADSNTGPDMVLLSAGPAQAEPWGYSTTVVLRGDVATLSEGDTFHGEIEVRGRIDYDTLIGGSNSAVGADLLTLR